MGAEQEPGEISDLTDELFSKVQRAQGFAFISDGWSGGKTKAEFLKWAQERLDWNNEASKIIRAFIRKHKAKKMTASTKPDVAETLRELRDLGPGGHTLHVNGKHVGWAHEHAATVIESLQAELAKARQSILKFGHHTASCAWSLHGGACNCGWFDVSRVARAFQGEK